MLFENGIFSPQSLGDRRTEAVLYAAVDRASGKVRPGSLLVAAIESKDAKVLTMLTQAVAADCPLQDLQKVIEVYDPPRLRSMPADFDGRRVWFSDETLAALDQFDTDLADLSKRTEDVREVILELLLACVLSHWNTELPEKVKMILNTEGGAALFSELVNSTVDPPSTIV